MIKNVPENDRDRYFKDEVMKEVNLMHHFTSQAAEILNIVKILDYSIDENKKKLYIILELCEIEPGMSTLSDYIEYRKKKVEIISELFASDKFKKAKLEKKIK